MPADRQRRILDFLQAGPASLGALIRALGQEQAALTTASLRRLTAAGRVVVNQRHKHDLAAMVELGEPVVRPSQPRRRPATDLATIAERWAR